MNNNTTTFRSGLLLLLLLFQATSIQAWYSKCTNQNGDKLVDYWFIRKLPNSKSFFYLDSTSSKIQYYADITNPKGALPSSMHTKYSNFYLFNDKIWQYDKKVPQSTHSSSTYRPINKGIVVFGTTLQDVEGIHIKHTLPGFPILIDNHPSNQPENFKTPLSYPDSWYPNDELENQFGHTFFCHSFTNVIDFVQVLKGAHPYVYSTPLFYTPAYFESLKDLLKYDPVSTPLTNTFNGGVQLITTSSAPDQWKSLNVIPTAHIKFPESGYDIVTETHLPYDLSKEYNIPQNLQRWRSSIDKSFISFDPNSNKVCIGDNNGDKNLPDYIPAESILCLDNAILSRFLKLTSAKVRKTGTTTEIDYLQQTLFKGPLQISSINPFPTTSPSYQYFESLPDYSLKTSSLKIINFDSTNTALSESEIISSDSNSMVEYNKNYKPSFSLLLQDSVLVSSSFKLQFVNAVDSTVISIPVEILDGLIQVKPSNELEKTLITLYKTVQLIINSINQLLSSVSSPPLPSITVVIDTSIKTAKINQFTINLNNICFENIFTYFSQQFLQQLNGQYTISTSIMEYEFDTVGTSLTQPLIKGLINTFAMYLRQSIFKSLSQDSLQSLDTCSSSPRNIEYFNTPNFNSLSGSKTEGWVTAFLWDLLDDNKDSRNDKVFVNDDNSIPIQSILSVIQQNNAGPPQDGIIPFANLIGNAVSDKSRFINQLLFFNNLIKCNPQKSCTPEFTDPDPLIRQFTNLGLCSDDIKSFISISKLKEYAMLWAGDNSNIPNWTRNRLFPVLYKDPNFNSKYQQLGAYMNFETYADTLCSLGPLDQSKPLSIPSMVKISNELFDYTQMAKESHSFQDLSIYYLPPKQSSQTKGLGIVTYGGLLCNFDFIQYSTFSSGELYNLCPIPPMITNIQLHGATPPVFDEEFIERVSVFEGAPAESTSIVIYGRNLFSMPLLTPVSNVIVRFGQNECPITSYNNPTLPSEPQSIICQGPKGVGIQPITVKTITTSDLPILTENPIQYQFKYYAPIIESIIYPENEQDKIIDPSSTTELTLVGMHFFDDPNNPSLNQLVKVKTETDQFTISKFERVSGKDRILFKAFGVGENNNIELIVADQIGNEPNLENPTIPLDNPHSILDLDFEPPVITSITKPTNWITGCSPVEGGDTIIVNGKNFGSSGKYEIMVYIGQVKCLDVKWLSNTQISAVVPYNVGKDRPITVQIGNQVNENPSVTLCYDKPELYQITNGFIYTNNESKFWITGKNLGTKSGFTPIVELYSDEDFYLDCYAEPNVYMNRPYLNANGDPISVPTEQPDPYENYDPYIDLDPSYRSTIDFDCFFCIMTPGIGKDIDFRMTVFNQEIQSSQVKYKGNTEKSSIAFTPNHVEKMEPNNHSFLKPKTTGGGTLEIEGYNMVPNEWVPIINLNIPVPIETIDSGPDFNYITIDYESLGTSLKFQCKSVKWIDSNKVTCEIPPGYGQDLPVAVWVGNQRNGNYGKVLFSYDKPSVKREEPIIRRVKVGQKVRIDIKGENFVPQSLADQFSLDNDIFVIHGEGEQQIERVCISVTWVDDQLAYCELPQLTGENLKIKVKVGGQVSEPVLYYSYERPLIEEINPKSIRMTEKVSITMIGENFGIVNAEPRPIVRLKLFEETYVATCGPVQNIEGTFKQKMICEVGPFQNDGDYTMTVELDGQTSETTLSSILNVHGRVKINQITPSSPVDGGELIKIIGENLKEEQGPTTLKVNGEPTNIVSYTNHEIVFMSVPGGGTRISVIVDVNGQIVESQLYSYTAPHINSITPSSIPTDQVTRIAISGSNLGRTDLSSQVNVLIGALPCTGISVVSSSRITCLAPLSTEPQEVPVTLEFRLQIQDNLYTFAYTGTTNKPETNTPRPGGSNISAFIKITLPGLVLGGGAAIYFVIDYIGAETVVTTATEVPMEIQQVVETPPANTARTLKFRPSTNQFRRIHRSRVAAHFNTNMTNFNSQVQELSDSNVPTTSPQTIGYLDSFEIISTSNNYLFEYESEGLFESSDAVILSAIAHYDDGTTELIELAWDFGSNLVIPIPSPTPTPTSSPNIIQNVYLYMDNEFLGSKPNPTIPPPQESINVYLVLPGNVKTLFTMDTNGMVNLVVPKNQDYTISVESANGLHYPITVNTNQYPGGIIDPPTIEIGIFSLLNNRVPAPVKFYDQPNQKGLCLTLPVGRYNFAVLYRLGWANKIQSFDSLTNVNVYISTTDSVDSVITTIPFSGLVNTGSAVGKLLEITYKLLIPDTLSNQGMDLLIDALYRSMPTFKMNGKDLYCQLLESQYKCWVPSTIEPQQITINVNGGPLYHKYTIQFTSSSIPSVPPQPQGYLLPNHRYTSPLTWKSTDGSIVSSLEFTSSDGTTSLKVRGQEIFRLDKSNFISTSQDGPYFLTLQQDGNFCIYVLADFQVAWCSMTNEMDIKYLQMTPLGMVLQNQNGEVVWSRQTISENYKTQPIHPIAYGMTYIDSLDSNRDRIGQNQWITNGKHYLTVKSDGELYLMDNTLTSSGATTLWVSNFKKETSNLPTGPFYLHIGVDGNLCMRTTTVVYWCAYSHSQGGRYLAVMAQDSLNVDWGIYLLSSDGRMVWGRFSDQGSTSLSKHQYSDPYKFVGGNFLYNSQLSDSYKFQTRLNLNEIFTNGQFYLRLENDGILRLYDGPHNSRNTPSVKWSSGNVGVPNVRYVEFKDKTISIVGSNSQQSVITGFASSTFFNIAFKNDDENIFSILLTSPTKGITGGYVSIPNDGKYFYSREGSGVQISNNFLKAGIVHEGNIYYFRISDLNNPQVKLFETYISLEKPSSFFHVGCGFYDNEKGFIYFFYIGLGFPIPANPDVIWSFGNKESKFALLMPGLRDFIAIDDQGKIQNSITNYKSQYSK
eukprot:gene9633-11807_t